MRLTIFALSVQLFLFASFAPVLLFVPNARSVTLLMPQMFVTKYFAEFPTALSVGILLPAILVTILPHMHLTPCLHAHIVTMI